MKKNKYAANLKIEDVLDLHGLTDYEAEFAVLDFLKNSRDSGFRVVKIITGKGLHSAHEPVMKKITREILREQNLVYTTAKIQDGGTGAFVIRLS